MKKIIGIILIIIPVASVIALKSASWEELLVNIGILIVFGVLGSMLVGGVLLLTE